MQFTKALVVLSALAGFTIAAPAPFEEVNVDERSYGREISLTFTGTNGTVYNLNAPNSWKAIKTEKSSVVNKVTINTALSTCILVGGRGNVFVEAALFGANTITINPAQSINVVACAGLASTFIH